MANVHYFPRYTQKENFSTNNSLLLMYRLYEYSIIRFQKFLILLLDDQDAGKIKEAGIGLQFEEQPKANATKKKSTVLDAQLVQKALRIAVETKLDGGQFTQTQIDGHLQIFERGGTNFLFLLSPSVADISGAKWEETRNQIRAKDIILVASTFEKIIECARSVLQDHDEVMLNLIEDFELFCSESDLLDSDRTSMMMVPCGKSVDINANYSLYFCPVEYKHRSIKFIGIYAKKAIRMIGVVDKIVYFDAGRPPAQWRVTSHYSDASLTEKDVERIQGAARDAYEDLDYDIKHGYKFYLFSETVETEFCKSSAGGLFGHKYFDLGILLKKFHGKLQILAEELRKQQWGG